MNDRSRLRLIILSVLVLSLPLTLAGRLWYMQALAGDQYAAALNKTATRDVPIVAPRGMIVDDLGRPLARNDSALVVSAISTLLPKANLGTDANPKPNPKRVDEMQRLSQILGVPAAELEAKATLCDYAKYGQQAPQKNPGCWTGSPLQPIPLYSVDNSTPGGVQRASAVALQVLEQQELFPGVTAQIQDARSYPAPQNASAAQLIGHVGKITGDDIAKAKTDADKQLLTSAAGAGGVIGQEGLEAEYNQYLEGKLGTKTMSVDPAGNPLSTLSEVEPTPGDAVVTSIDARVQAIAEQALADAVNRARTVPQRLFGKNMTVPADAGAAVVFDARTGHVIAAANYPTYSPSVWDGGSIDPKVYKQLSADPGKPLFSQAIQGQYAPGSTFKVITTSGAVTTPFYSLSGSYDCPTHYAVGGQTFTNFEGETGAGKISFAEALKISCDTYFYALADNLWKADGGVHATHPADAIINEAKLWGLGKYTGIDLPIDATGNIETRQQKLDQWNKNKALWCADWPTEKDPYIRAIVRDNCQDGYQYREGDALNFAVGQGTVTLSPLQLAVAYAALANGGTLFSPRVGKAIVGPDGSLVKKIDAPSTKLQVPANVLNYVRDALSAVVSQPGGTAYNAFAGFPLDRYAVSGKTGTAEVQGKIDTAWFASFGGPVGQPAQYAVVVMVSQGGQGGVTSAPAVRQIYDGIYGLDGNGTNPNDMYAKAGPALPAGAPPAALPNLKPAPVASASPSASPSSSPASASASSSSPKAMGPGDALLAPPPDRHAAAGPPTAAWAR
ncbi:MAG TPA: penicillin-binding transpeptidase domain-containing protein [Acidothermaceae bacterium]|nr:penicillin-binding transpeptidase domain-containing protein [Acidothermaceae bacterium]